MEINSLSKIESDSLNQHGAMFNFLIYTAIFSTILLFFSIKSESFFAKNLAKLFNSSFTFRGEKWRLYNIFILVIFFFCFLFLCNLE